MAGQAQPHAENRKLVKHLNVEAGALFTYLTTDGVDATNSWWFVTRTNK